MKPFTEIESDAEYLRAVGFKVKTCGFDVYIDVRRPEDGSGWCHEVLVRYLGLHDTDPAHKWDNLANVLRVLGPEMDRRGWRVSFGPNWCSIWEADTGSQIVSRIESDGGEPTHTTLLEAFYNAHAAQGDDA